MNKIIISLPLFVTLAVASWMLETGEPAKMFPLVVPELWKVAYGQTPTTIQDPELQKYQQIINNCAAVVNKMYPNAATSTELFMKPPTQGTTSADWQQISQCRLLLQQGINLACNNITTYDQNRCTAMSTPEIAMLIEKVVVIDTQEFLYGTDQSLLGPHSPSGGGGVFP